MEELRSIVKKYLPKGTTLNEEVLDKCIRELLDEFVKDWKENFELQREEFAKDLECLPTTANIEQLIQKYKKK